MPGSGKQTDPGFSGVMAKGAITWHPVSVCHHVSIIGAWSAPIFFLNHMYA